MATPLRKVMNRISSFTYSWRRKGETPHGRRIFRGDVEEEEFEYGAPHCLSSYYSVFVARLAIMVRTTLSIHSLILVVHKQATMIVNLYRCDVMQVMLAILIGLLTILTWHFTKVYTTKSLNTLAYGLRYQILQRPILRMWNILNSTVEITNAQVRLSEYVIRRYSKSTSQAEQVEVSE